MVVFGGLMLNSIQGIKSLCRAVVLADSNNDFHSSVSRIEFS